MFARLRPSARHVPRGYSHGIVVAAGGRTVYVAGQLGSDSTGVIQLTTFAAQFTKALENVVAVVEEAGGVARNIASMRIYVTDFGDYRKSKEAVAVVWRRRFEDYYPAIAIVQVVALVDPAAMVEIEAIAHV